MLFGNEQKSPVVSVVRCPACQEFLSAEAKSCKRCGTPMTSEMRLKAIESIKRENSGYRAASYRKAVGGGLLSFLISFPAFYFSYYWDDDGTLYFYPKVIAFAGISFFGGLLTMLGFGWFWLQEKRGK
jgi:hypothetical protein